MDTSLKMQILEEENDRTINMPHYVTYRTTTRVFFSMYAILKRPQLRPLTVYLEIYHVHYTKLDVSSTPRMPPHAAKVLLPCLIFSDFKGDNCQKSLDQQELENGKLPRLNLNLTCVIIRCMHISNLTLNGCNHCRDNEWN